MIGKRYIHTTKAWYWPHGNERPEWEDEIFFYTDEPFGEMAMRWYDIGRKGVLAPRIEIFVESVNALATLPDVQAAIAQYGGDRDGELTPDAFCALLESCGFVDKTPLKYKDSYPTRKQK